MATEEETDHIRQRINIEEEDVIYDASERGDVYHCIRLLWCGCCEPYPYISTQYIKQEKWKNCQKISDSIAMENVSDAVREQSICCGIASGCCCCCCIDDFGDIIIFGGDESSESNKLVLKNISNCTDVHDRLSKHLSKIHQQNPNQPRTSNPTDE